MVILPPLYLRGEKVNDRVLSFSRVSLASVQDEGKNNTITDLTAEERRQSTTH